jgi:hypothetical protein
MPRPTVLTILQPPTAVPAVSAPAQASTAHVGADGAASRAVGDEQRREQPDRLLRVVGAVRAMPTSVAVECRAPLSVRLDRARRRGFDTGAASDADAGVVRRQEDDGELAEDVPPASTSCSAPTGRRRMRSTTSRRFSTLVSGAPRP